MMMNGGGCTNSSMDLRRLRVELVFDDTDKNELEERGLKLPEEEDDDEPTTVVSNSMRTRSASSRRFVKQQQQQQQQQQTRSNNNNKKKKKKTTTTSTTTAPQQQQQEDDSATPMDSVSYCLRSTCLHPQYKLQTQLLFAFGTVNICIVLFVIAICILVSLFMGSQITQSNKQEFTLLAITNEASTTRYLSYNIKNRFMPIDLVTILTDATRERFQIPDDDDDHATTTTYTSNSQQQRRHTDIHTGAHRYPIIGNPVPLEWDASSYNQQAFVTNKNYNEHVQGRWNESTFYQKLPFVTTANAAWIVRGSCNPKTELDCTDDNNDLKWGGSVSPSATFRSLYRKANDLVPLMKTLFEVQENVRDLGLYFFNQGTGATINFPHYPISRDNNYTSIGCNWMIRPKQQGDQQQQEYSIITTPEQVMRATISCAAEGTIVNTRYYNPMERGWCRDQALNPNSIRIDVYEDAWNKGEWLLSLGKAIYIPTANNKSTFLACSYIGITLDSLEKVLPESKFSENSEVAVIKYDPVGTVIASTTPKPVYQTARAAGSPKARDPSSTNPPTITMPQRTIDELNIGISKELYEQLYTLIDYTSEVWDPLQVREAYESFAASILPSYKNDLFFVSAYPIPPVPEIYDPTYVPHLFVIRSTSKLDLFAVTEEIEENVNKNVSLAIVFSIIAGAIGLLCTSIVIMITAKTLTSPLQYMNQAMDDIMDNFGNTTTSQDTNSTNFHHTPREVATTTASTTILGEVTTMDTSTNLKNGAREDDNEDEEKNLPKQSTTAAATKTKTKNTKKTTRKKYPNNILRYYYYRIRRYVIPKTELTMVVQQFDKMVSNFSGGSLCATRSEKMKLKEIQNQWNPKNCTKEMFFQPLYQSRQTQKKNPNSREDNNNTASLSSSSSSSTSTEDEEDDFIFQVNENEDDESTTPTMDGADTDTKTSPAIQTDDNNDKNTNKETPSSSGNNTNSSFVNAGKLIIQQPQDLLNDESNWDDTIRSFRSSTNHTRWKSPLFLWIAILIITPFLLTTVTIMSVVMTTVSTKLTSSIVTAQDTFLNFRLRVLRAQVALRADDVRGLTSKATQDLNILTRYGSWLLFDGIQRDTTTYTKMTTGVERCKTYVEDGEVTKCPYYQEHNICDCSWDFDSPDFCQLYNHSTTHYQVPFFSVQAQDNHPQTGNISKTSYPNNSYSPATTVWFDDQRYVPGYDKASNASGYETTYDRLRVMSAVPIIPMMFHYGTNKKSGAGIFYTFEADGLTVGYTGCTNALHVEDSLWSSTEENAAATLRPELCPVGKFGYDPRCRGWYDSGRKKLLEENKFLYVTAPYRYATESIFGQSATSPLFDSRTGEHVGQVLVDFLATSIFTALESKNTPLPNTGFPILISPHTDNVGNDAVIGPNFDFGSESRRIVELVLPYDTNCQSNICRERVAAFRKIVYSMKAGNSSSVTFERTTSNGGSEKIHLSYSPVTLRSNFPINSSDFSRGIESSEYLIYSLGLAASEDGILESFKNVAANTHRAVNIAIVVLVFAIFGAVILVVFISYRVAISITATMVYLLDLIRAINQLDVKQDTPTVDKQWGSVEIFKVSETMETLYNVVQSANDAFYTGQVEVAYVVLMDSLRLFESLNNKKAIGVACNNLGNTLLSMYRLMNESEVETICGLTKEDIIAKGTKYFFRAIKLGEKLYDEFYDSEGWTPRCLDFMQHLSNRYFNRGIFLLTVKGDHKKPMEIETLGLRDLQISRDMDAEVIAYGEEIGWDRVGHVVDLYSVATVRAKGYNLLLEMGYGDEWELEDLLKELFNTVRKETAQNKSDLFAYLSPIGRLQEVENQLMAYYTTIGDIATAAKIAIRLLVEDEYTLADAHIKALTTLLAYVDASDCLDDSLKRELHVQLNGALFVVERDILDQTERETKSEVRGSVFTRSSSQISGNAVDIDNDRCIRWFTKEKSGSYLTMEAF